MTDFDPFHIGRFSSGEYPTAKELTKVASLVPIVCCEVPGNQPLLVLYREYTKCLASLFTGNVHFLGDRHC